MAITPTSDLGRIWALVHDGNVLALHQGPAHPWHATQRVVDVTGADARPGYQVDLQGNVAPYPPTDDTTARQRRYTVLAGHAATAALAGVRVVVDGVEHYVDTHYPELARLMAMGAAGDRLAQVAVTAAGAHMIACRDHEAALASKLDAGEQPDLAAGWPHGKAEPDSVPAGQRLVPASDVSTAAAPQTTGEATNVTRPTGGEVHDGSNLHADPAAPGGAAEGTIDGKPAAQVAGG